MRLRFPFSAQALAPANTPRPLSQGKETQRRAVILSTGLLSVIAGLGLLVLWTSLEAPGSAVLLLVFATPISLVLAHGLARAGYLIPGSAAALLGAAVTALVAARYHPSWVPSTSTFLMLTVILVLAAQVMSFESAAVLAWINVVLALALPQFLPLAVAGTIEIPYLFLFLNSVFIGFAAVLRYNDAIALHRADERVMEQDEHIVQVERESAERRRFLDAASHEIKTPLTPLILQIAAYRIRFGPRLDQDQLRAIGLLERNLQRMARLVGDLLDVARVDNRTVPLELATVAVDDVVGQACDVFSAQAAHARIDLRRHMSRQVVEADEAKLSQIAFNLISNAIKFCPPEGRIDVDVAAEDGGALISVRDSGPGLSPAQAAGLFRPFGQVHAERSAEGTGLGLYICQSIAHQHGGRIWSESDGPGKGATFHVWLPSRVPLEAVTVQSNEDRLA